MGTSFGIQLESSFSIEGKNRHAQEDEDANQEHSSRDADLPGNRMGGMSQRPGAGKDRLQLEIAGASRISKQRCTAFWSAPGAACLPRKLPAPLLFESRNRSSNARLQGAAAATGLQVPPQESGWL